MQLYCSILFCSFCFKLAKDTTGTLRKVVNKLHRHNASVWLKIKMLSSIVVKTHPKPLRLCPPLVNHCWGLPWVTVLILSSPSCRRTSRGFHHQFQAAACSKDLWTTLPLPQPLQYLCEVTPYSYASLWASHQRHLCMHAHLHVPACGWGSCRSGGWVSDYTGCLRPVTGECSLCMYIYLYVCIFSHNRLLSWSAKQVKRVRLLVPLEFCVSAAFFALICISGQTCLHICIHIYTPSVCVCEVGNTCLTSVLAAPKNMKLW